MAVRNWKHIGRWDLLPCALVLTTAMAVAQDATPQPSADAAEQELWEALTGGGDPDAYRAYLDFYPDGVFADEARHRIESLTGGMTDPVGASAAEATPGSAGRAGPAPLHLCDVHGADPDDPMRVAPGIPLAMLDIGPALSACELAVATHPEAPRFRYQLARILEYAGRLPEAMPHYRQAAASGHPGARYYFAVLFHYGCRDLAEADYAEAIDWLKEALKSGYLPAAANLSLVYFWAEGVAEDPAEAVAVLQYAADRGDPTAQAGLARAYRRGRGIEKDPAAADEWDRLSLDAFRQRGLAGNYQMSRSVAVRLESGSGTDKDAEEAAHWQWLTHHHARRMAERGNLGAMGALAADHLQRRSGPKDAQKAVEWYRKAADGGSLYAMEKLGEIYAKGEGIASQPDKAETWRRRTFETIRAYAGAGDAYYMMELARLHRDGEGTVKNAELADQWQERAEAACRAGRLVQPEE